MSCTECCALMKSCILPQQNPTNAVTTAPVNPLGFIVTAPVAGMLFGEPLAQRASYPDAETPRAGYVHSRQAVLCTFLI